MTVTIYSLPVADVVGWSIVGWLGSRMYLGETAGRIELPLGTGIKPGLCHTLFDGFYNPLM